MKAQRDHLRELLLYPAEFLVVQILETLNGSVEVGLLLSKKVSS
jgi:Mlc titration factor MtfA (ptsG expression regulator)